MSRDIELQLHRIAARQHSLVTRRQALDLGFTAQAIRTKTVKGLWIAVRRGLYDVGGSPPTWEQRVMTEVLSGGLGAAASHLCAAYLHRVSSVRPEVMDVTVPHGRHPASVKGRRVHRSRVLPRSDVTTLFGIPVTRMPRTLVDAASILSEYRLESILDAALVTGRTSIPAMRRYVANHANKPQIDVLKKLLDDREHGVPESELERAFERIMRDARLPMPERQRQIRKYRVDYLYEGERIAIEVDGSATRSTKAELQRDRRRQNEIVLQQLVILRFTWDDVTKDAAYVVAVIKRALDGAGGGS
jgi:very-short-patch-repair endonuclease